MAMASRTPRSGDPMEIPARFLAAVSAAALGLSAPVRAETKVYPEARVQFDVRDDWKVEHTGESNLVVSDPTGGVVLGVEILEAGELTSAIQRADGVVKRYADHVQWRKKPVSRDLHGMKALSFAGTARYKNSKIDIGALIVTTPANTPLLVFGLIDSTRAAALQPQIDALVNSIQPMRGIPARPGPDRTVPAGAPRVPVRPSSPSTDSDDLPAVTGFAVEYLPPSAKFQPMLAIARGSELEGFVDALNQYVIVPRLVRIEVRECGKINAYYSPYAHIVRVCYEFIAQAAAAFKPDAQSDSEVRKRTAGLLKFTLMHELTHALTGELELPIAGKEEDAADEFAAILLTLEGDRGFQAALAAAQWFGSEGQKKVQSGAIMWSDEHSFDLQRMFGIVCILYGATPARYERLAKSLGMPADRLERCVVDYPRKVKVWDALLAPHRHKQTSSAR